MPESAQPYVTALNRALARAGEKQRFKTAKKGTYTDNLSQSEMDERNMRESLKKPGKMIAATKWGTPTKSPRWSLSGSSVGKALNKAIGVANTPITKALKLAAKAGIR